MTTAEDFRVAATMWEPGQRVAVFLHATPTEVHLLGYGVFHGLTTRPGGRRLMADPDVRKVCRGQLYERDEVVLPRYLEKLEAMVRTGQISMALAKETYQELKDNERELRARPIEERVDDFIYAAVQTEHCVLDSGEPVYGYQAFACREEQFEAFRAGRALVLADVPPLTYGNAAPTAEDLAWEAAENQKIIE